MKRNLLQNYNLTPKYKAEDGEVVEGKNVRSTGRLSKVSPNAVEVSGNKHSAGGEMMSGGNLVYSDKVKFTPKELKELGFQDIPSGERVSPAMLKKHLEKIRANSSKPGEFSTATQKYLAPRIMQQLEKLRALQVSIGMKGATESLGKEFGEVPEMALGGLLNVGRAIFEKSKHYDPILNPEYNNAMADVSKMGDYSYQGALAKSDAATATSRYAAKQAGLSGAGLTAMMNNIMNQGALRSGQIIEQGENTKAQLSGQMGQIKFGMGESKATELRRVEEANDAAKEARWNMLISGLGDIEQTAMDVYGIGMLNKMMNPKKEIDTPNKMSLLSEDSDERVKLITSSGLNTDYLYKPSINTSILNPFIKRYKYNGNN